jgi:hypothetical protein
MPRGRDGHEACRPRLAPLIYVKFAIQRGGPSGWQRIVILTIMASC